MIAYLSGGLGYVLTALFIWSLLVRPRVAKVNLPQPRTWADFCRDPRPIIAPDVPLRSGDPHGHEDVATVYNHAAALLRMRHGRL